MMEDVISRTVQIMPYALHKPLPEFELFLDNFLADFRGSLVESRDRWIANCGRDIPLPGLQ